MIWQRGTHRLAAGAAVLGLVLLAGCEISVEQSAVEPVEGPLPAQQARVPNPRVHRGHLDFVEGYQAGSSRAAAESKPMLVFFTAQWCSYCHQMAQEAFTHPQVVTLSRRFVCVLIDADEERDVCHQFGVTGYPTIQFLSPRGVPLERLVGKKAGHQLMTAMQSALQRVALRGDDVPLPPPR